MKSSASDQHKENGNGLTYHGWYSRANRACRAAGGVDLSDLPDACYADAWEADEDPAKFGESVLAAECVALGIDPATLGIYSGE